MIIVNIDTKLVPTCLQFGFFLRERNTTLILEL